MPAGDDVTVPLPLTATVSVCTLPNPVVVWTELFAAFASAVVLLTVALLAIDPVWVCVPTIVTVALPPLASVPRSQVTVWPLAEHDADAETNVTDAASVSVTTTADAAAGPALWTAIVYVVFEPTRVGSGESDSVVERSGWSTDVHGTEAEL